MKTRIAGLLLVLAALPVLASPPAAAQTAAPAASAGEAEIDKAPVVIDGETLFLVRGASSLAAKTRAKRIGERIEAAAGNPAIPIDAIRAIDSGETITIMADDSLLMVITEADARVEQLGRADLTRVHLERIRGAVAEYREVRSAGALRRGAFYSIGATAAAALAVAFLLWLGRWLDRLLERRVQTRIRSLAVQSFEFVRAERIGAALRGTVRGLFALTIAVMAFFWLDFVLAQFPWTRPLSRHLLDLVMGPLAIMGKAILGKVPDLVFLAVLFLVFRFALRLVRMFFHAIGRGAVSLSSFDRDWAEPTYKIVRFVIVAFGLVVAYPYIPGSESAAFKGVSLFLGVLFSLGSSSAIANMIAGLMMTYRRAFRIGDRVKIGDVVGDVTEMRLQVTHLRTVKNEEVTIPNSQILNTHVVNYSSLAHTKGLILHTEVGIGYETPWRQVEAMLLAAAERTPGLLREPAPFVRQKKLGDFAVTYEINAYTGDALAMEQIYTDLHRNILDLFNEYGVQIMTPAYEGDAVEPKVVAKKDWFLAPAAPPPEAST
ncbi:MAG TPA: mechanosensitive ion channel family protein [Burkholderiales bacterium]|nr:mechanosensitive ion channel family protein [Burkholderiales bacterium]